MRNLKELADKIVSGAFSMHLSYLEEDMERIANGVDDMKDLENFDIVEYIEYNMEETAFEQGIDENEEIYNIFVSLVNEEMTRQGIDTFRQKIKL